MTAAGLPVFHIRPSRGWINDPNGVVRHAGRWHVFFQHNPARAQHGDIHWGHVSSPDLLTWTEHPVAFGPEPGGPDRGGCWSGVFLPWSPRPAVAYTGIGASAADAPVCVRYAVADDLVAWSPPVVVATAPADLDLREMRDPFLFEWDGRRFALLGAGLRDGTPAVLLYSLDDLEAWRFERVWLTSGDVVLGQVAPAEIWECPQLVEVDGAWVLLLSLWADGEPDRVIYAVGSLAAGDDGLPTFRASHGGAVDTEPTFYAPQVVPDAGGPLMFGWVRQDDAPDDALQDAVAGCLTLPRRLSLVDRRLVSTVDPALRGLVGPGLEVPDGRLPAAAFVTVETGPGAEGALTLTGVDGPVVVCVDRRTEVWLDGDVLEIYPAGGTPSTHRQPGTATWAMTSHGVRVTARSIVPPVRA